MNPSDFSKQNKVVIFYCHVITHVFDDICLDSVYKTLQLSV